MDPAFPNNFQPFNLCGTNQLSKSGFGSFATTSQDSPMSAATMYMNMQGPLTPNMDGECNVMSSTQTPNISQYLFPNQQEAPNYARSPAAPYSGQESSLPLFCLASSPERQETASLMMTEEEGSCVGQCTTNNSNMHQSLQSLGSPDGYCFFTPGRTFTPEEEDQHKWRKEMSKIAATKCRNKKKEKTANFVQESVHLEATNVGLNKEIRQLQAEIQRVKSVLENHRCTFPVRQNSHFMPMPIIYNRGPQPPVRRSNATGPPKEH